MPDDNTLPPEAETEIDSDMLRLEISRIEAELHERDERDYYAKVLVKRQQVEYWIARVAALERGMSPEKAHAHAEATSYDKAAAYAWDKVLKRRKRNRARRR